MSDSRVRNADRFTGFADIYDAARPVMPAYVAEQITAYLGRRPDTVVDLGCGTGLSSLSWRGHCRRVIGVEPSAEMSAMAEPKAGEGVSFRPGFGNDTGLPDGCADVVVCSQSFHWMEPTSTLREAARLLMPGGVFATVDCDWPPITDWRAEGAYMRLYEKVRRLEREMPDVNATFTRYPKSEHLNHMRESGWFAYCREIVFQNTEFADTQRFVSLLLSQGSLQTLLRLHPECIEADFARFREEVTTLLPTGQFPLTFCYRMRVGVRGE